MREEIDDFPAAETTVRMRQMKRNLKMAESDDRFDAMLQELIKDIIIELETLLVRFCLVTFREDACPADGRTQHF